MRLIHFVLVAFTALTFCLPQKSSAQPFVHPGIDQRATDLAYMKKLVLDGRQPWKAAYERLLAGTDTNFVVRPYTHVLRGPYGKPNIGGDDLSRSAGMAYNCALAWYISGKRAYARKAIEILNAWSPVLWDLDYNDAKLLAAWTGHVLCNAAEILRYSHAGWQQKDISSFTNMLLTVYYPLIRYYYPQANGNWDGAIIHTILSIAIFTDDRKMFNNAVDHFLHGPVNGSIFKYIYPSGQCQETMRDQGHVQLGLGEFAGAAQVAFTQGTDLFSIGNNRIALGYEYTARFLLGETPYSYGKKSERSKILRDDYEYVYRQYAAMGIDLPWTKKAADSVRPKASRSILAAVRAPSGKPVAKKGTPAISTVGYIAGAGAAAAVKIPDDAIIVSPGQSVQEALDSAAAKKGWVLVKNGIHTFPHTLRIPAGITLCGEGEGTILFLDPASGEREAMINADNDLHDVTIRDLVIEGSNRTDPGTDPNSRRSYRGGYNRGGILFRSLKEGQMQHLHFVHVTIRNCTYSGLSISGADDVRITGCDFTENGVSVPPGQHLLHNLQLLHCSAVNIKDSRFDTSPYGCGIALDHCRNAAVSNCEVARNGWYGILTTESKNIAIRDNLIEGNDRSGILLEYLRNGSDDITVSNNRIQYNAGYGVESYAVRNAGITGNRYAGNGNNAAQEKISGEKVIGME
jgi:parallel beta-helix repeat protein